jgi:tellurite resistance protein TehA-like permease
MPSTFQTIAITISLTGAIVFGYNMFCMRGTFDDDDSKLSPEALLRINHHTYTAAWAAIVFGMAMMAVLFV